MTSFVTASTFQPTNLNISGIVSDAETGNAISGAIVSVKHSSQSVLTKADGSFSINIKAENCTLIISYTGFISREVKMNSNSTSLNVALQPQKTSKKASPADVIRKQETQAAPLYELSGRAAGIALGATGNTDNFNTEDYSDIVENRFHVVTDDPLSTFSVDVDGASYSNVRRFLQNDQLPPAGAVRIEEFINYFHYEYPQPTGEHPFSINTEIAQCPWNNKNKLVMIGLQGKKIPVNNLPSSNLVFLIDVSGSMQDPNKLPLVKSSLKLLLEQLREDDRISIVVYAGAAGLVLPSTSGTNKQKIRNAIDALEAGGSTAGGAGIRLAYKVARQNFIEDGNNRVILCTDGDFNIGASSDAEMVKIVEDERKSGVFLTVLGYGMGNYKDNKMQLLADKGNGNHSYIDNINEAKKVLVNEFGGTLFTIAKDVKLQVEFNPATVRAYRLVGYENRILNKEDFNNDEKDAGDIGSGHTVTALYEIVPAGVSSEFLDKTDPLKYQNNTRPAVESNDLLTVKFRYKQPSGNKSRLIERVVSAEDMNIKSSDNFRFATAVAEFGMLLSDSEFRQDASFNDTWNLAHGAMGSDEEGYRTEFLDLVRAASKLKSPQANINR